LTSAFLRRTAMQDLEGEAAEAQRELNRHVSEMESAAVAIEDILGIWTQEWCRSTVEAAIARDVHTTQTIRAGSTRGDFAEEVKQLEDALPARLRTELRRTVWRHEFIDASRKGTADVGSDRDYGIWQHSGYKIPPAYEGAVSGVFSRVTQLLRKYGYRQAFGGTAEKHRYSAPHQAVAPMESYYRLSARLPEVVIASEESRRRVARRFAGTSWDRE
jgi:hypothetical protein